MTVKETELAAVAEFDERYRDEYLDEKITGTEPDPFNIRLLFESVFASARSQSVSRAYRQASEQVLRAHEAKIRARWHDEKDGITDEQLQEALEAEGVTNQYDREMVVDLIDLLEEIGDQSVNEYAEQRIEDGALDELFDRLTAVQNIGPKKATLYLRDVVVLRELESYVTADQYRYCFPVDTWVHRVGQCLSVVETKELDWQQDSETIVATCLKNGISPLSFNQGAWYLGSNSFEIVMEHVESVVPE
jgi:endonuclease III